MAAVSYAEQEMQRFINNNVFHSQFIDKWKRHRSVFLLDKAIHILASLCITGTWMLTMNWPFLGFRMDFINTCFNRVGHDQRQGSKFSPAKYLLSPLAASVIFPAALASGQVIFHFWTLFSSSRILTPSAHRCSLTAPNFTYQLSHHLIEAPAGSCVGITSFE